MFTEQLVVRPSWDNIVFQHLSALCPFLSHVTPVCRGLLVRGCHHGISQAEVPLSGDSGVPDHVPGAHHALLAHLAGRGAPLPGLLCCGGGRVPQDPHLCGACLQRS